MGPHPAVAQIRRAVREALVDGQGPVLVACSGGADSLALAAALAFEAPRLGREAGLVTVDHGLQPDSAEQARRVASLGYELGLNPVETLPVSVSGDGGPEAAARRARYAALGAVAQALEADILLGHTLDDQAETVLLGLGRGSGPRSIAGMQARTGPYLRPLLGVRRASTLAACRALGFEPWQDPHNSDPAYQRVRLRTEALPLLEEILQSGVSEALARTAIQLQADGEALDVLTQRFLDDQSSTAASGAGPEHALVTAALAQLPRALRTRALRGWALSAGATELSAGHIAAIEALVTDWHGQGQVDLPGGVSVTRRSGRLVLNRP